MTMAFNIAMTGCLATAFNIAEGTKKAHPFKDGFAGHGLYEGFKACHRRLKNSTDTSLQVDTVIRCMYKIHIPTYSCNPYTLSFCGPSISSFHSHFGGRCASMHTLGAVSS